MANLSNDILYAALNQLSVGIIIIDEQQRLVFFNQCLSDYSGMKLDENEGRFLGDIFSQYKNSRLSDACNSALSLGLPARLSHTFNPTPLPLYQKNFLGDEKHLIQQQISVKKIAVNASKPLCQIVIDNVTHMVKKEQTLKKLADENIVQRQKAEIANQSKSQFLANMSHEIRTPINGVLGMLSLLADTQLNQVQQHFSTLAKVSVETLLHLVNDILDFSKIEAGKLDIEQITFNLPNCIVDTVQAMAISAQIKGLEVIVDTTELTEELVVGDPNRLKQIITNLISNAIKFTANGEIYISVKESEKSLTAFKLVIAVTDTGIGIPSDKCAELFNAFTQVDASTTREYGGTGLGLTIVKQLCQLMGGDVEVSSQQGQGSRFAFNISVGLSEQPSEPLLHFSQKSVLLITTNLNSGKYLRKQMNLWGLDVVCVTEVEGSLVLCEKIINDDYSVLVIDEKLNPFLLEQISNSIIKKNALQVNLKNVNLLQIILLTPLTDSNGSKCVWATPLKNKGYLNTLTKPIVTDNFHQMLTDIFSSELKVMNTKIKNINYQSKILISDNSEQVDILVVEDNRINQEVALGLLRKMGHRADLAKNGVHALALIEQRQLSAPYKLILMDCQMPEMDGYQATIAIRTNEQYLLSNKVKIVAMTANTMSGDQEKCLTAGMNDYLPKPINPALLAEKISYWLAK